MFRFLFILLLSTFSTFALSAKPVLRVVAQEWRGATNADFTGTYWDIIREVYGDDYQLKFEVMSWENAINLATKQQADIVVGVYENQSPELLTPQTHLDMDSAFYLLYNDEEHNIYSIDDLQNLTIAGRNNYILKGNLPDTVNFYPIDKLSNLNKLIFNARIDGALIYAYELNDADPTQSLTHKKLIPKQKMYLGFTNSARGKVLSSIYDTKMPQLLSQGKIRELYPNEVSYQFANYNNNTAKSIINWFLIPKLYDQHKALKTIKVDHQFSLYVKEHLPDFNFNVKVGNMRVVNSAINPEVTTENNCVVNVFKNPKREQFALFSNPINMYLKPRLITHQKHRVNQFANNQPINLLELLSKKSDFKVGIIQQTSIDTTLRKELPKHIMDKLFIFEDKSYQNLFSLLKAERLDAIILWPTILPEIISNIEDIQPYESYEITSNLGNNAASYIMCTNTPVTKAFIETFNQKQQTPDQQQLLYENILNGFDKDSREIYKKALGLKLN